MKSYENNVYLAIDLSNSTTLTAHLIAITDTISEITCGDEEDDEEEVRAFHL
jgi:hypothetical protein